MELVYGSPSSFLLLVDSGQKVACETASGYVEMRQRVSLGKQVEEGGPVDGQSINCSCCFRGVGLLGPVIQWMSENCPLSGHS